MHKGDNMIFTYNGNTATFTLNEYNRLVSVEYTVNDNTPRYVLIQAFAEYRKLNHPELETPEDTAMRLLSKEIMVDSINDKTETQWGKCKACKVIRVWNKKLGPSLKDACCVDCKGALTRTSDLCKLPLKAN